ncbi:MAG: hypothetical protein ACJ71Y_11655 [Blastococcus sp.]
MSERMEMPADWLRYLQQCAEQRAEEIVQNVPQAPDYPPLPDCPTCAVSPERIVSRMSEPTFEQEWAAVLVDFKPCGHGFTVLESELLRG